MVAFAPTSRDILSGEGAPTAGVVDISAASIGDVLVLEGELALTGSTRRRAVIGVHPIVDLMLFAWVPILLRQLSWPEEGYVLWLTGIFFGCHHS